MSKREKIILVVVAIAALAAGYIQFLAPSDKGDGVNIEEVKKELATFVTSTSAVVAQAKPSDRALYTIAVTRKPWDRDPFIEGEESIYLKKAPDITFPDFSYTGFVAAGMRRLAVIDGMEYEVGQELDPPEFVLRNIFPDKVIIGVKDNELETTVKLVEEKL
jgi:hypothetical protein